MPLEWEMTYSDRAGKVEKTSKSNPKAEINSRRKRRRLERRSGEKCVGGDVVWWSVLLALQFAPELLIWTK